MSNTIEMNHKLEIVTRLLVVNTSSEIADVLCIERVRQKLLQNSLLHFAGFARADFNSSRLWCVAGTAEFQNLTTEGQMISQWTSGTRFSAARTWRLNLPGRSPTGTANHPRACRTWRPPTPQIASLLKLTGTAFMLQQPRRHHLFRHRREAVQCRAGYIKSMFCGHMYPELLTQHTSSIIISSINSWHTYWILSLYSSKVMVVGQAPSTPKYQRRYWKTTLRQDVPFETSLAQRDEIGAGEFTACLNGIVRDHQ